MAERLPDTAPGQRPVVATACGKLILLGEHAVVYGEPALAVPLLSRRLSVVLSPAEAGFRPRAPGREDTGAGPVASQSGLEPGEESILRRRRGMMPGLQSMDSSSDLMPLTPPISPALPAWSGEPVGEMGAGRVERPEVQGVELQGGQEQGVQGRGDGSAREVDSRLQGGLATLDMPAVGSQTGTPLVVEVDEHAPKGAQAGVSRALAAVSQTLGLELPLPLRVVVRSGGLGKGMGTSAALGTALARALLLWHGQEPKTAAVIAAAAAVEELFHGRPSGIDHTVSAWESPIWFEKDKEPQLLSRLAPLSLAVRPGLGTASTAQLVAGVQERLSADPALVRVLAALGRASREGRQAWAEGDFRRLGRAMESQQEGLKRLGVAHPQDVEGCRVAKEVGAMAAKITGAGGGGSLVALLDPKSPSTLKAVLAAWGPDSFALSLGDGAERLPWASPSKGW